MGALASFRREGLFSQDEGQPRGAIQSGIDVIQGCCRRLGCPCKWTCGCWGDSLQSLTALAVYEFIVRDFMYVFLVHVGGVCLLSSYVESHPSLSSCC